MDRSGFAPTYGSESSGAPASSPIETSGGTGAGIGIGTGTGAVGVDIGVSAGVGALREHEGVGALREHEHMPDPATFAANHLDCSRGKDCVYGGAGGTESESESEGREERIINNSSGMRTGSRDGRGTGCRRQRRPTHGIGMEI